MSDKSEKLHCPLGENDCPIFEHVDQLKQQVENLSNEVRTDHLTGLYNRRHLTFALEQEIERTQRTAQPTTLVLLDLDHFKQVNDTYGHIVGDKVLIHLANILKATVRKLDIPCRYGGEEFAVILPSTSVFVGAQVAERIRQVVANSPLQIDQETLHISASLGVDALSPNCLESPQELIDRADKQLYRAKKQGRNQVCQATQDIAPSAVSVTPSERDALFNSPED
ncbi:GGDEF domain-containing protein [Teredinibacter sp. KSP-S5-2]|uniref:GGDEF domain-containing protein n=1 Tax=Teredinibacter sp. KSP-S5-2 TaxID=3034506 RepID=UPI00293454BD|nr:GGDEF domain-containing protein [Teredinibacter sp. KSP-S5-2]WNO10894.1 GGDEF domain-containing protein [Teredinibacter sp. KSP-S5-2]